MGASELLIALAIAAAVAFGFYHYVNAKAETDKRALTIRRMVAIETALEKYCADCAGSLPSQKQTLAALCERPKVAAPKGWAGPYLKDANALKDGWNRDFHYLCPGRPYPQSTMLQAYDLSSYGRDGVQGGKGLDGDICNWDRKTMAP
jgi:general secretion pathway protein G